MTVTISPIFLLNMANNTVEDADLWDAITEKNLADWEAEWMPELFKATQKLHRANVERRFWPQSQTLGLAAEGGRLERDAGKSWLQRRLQRPYSGHDDSRYLNEKVSYSEPERPGSSLCGVCRKRSLESPRVVVRSATLSRYRHRPHSGRDRAEQS